MQLLVRWIERLSATSGMVIAWLVLPLILASSYEVFSRYVLNAPTIWAFELGYMAMGTHAIVGAAYTLRERGHIRIDVLYSRFSDKMRALVDVIGYLILFLPVTIWTSVELWNYWVEALVKNMMSGQSAWNPPIWPFRFAFFVGIALLALQGLAELIKAARVLLDRSESLDTSSEDE